MTSQRSASSSRCAPWPHACCVHCVLLASLQSAVLQSVRAIRRESTAAVEAKRAAAQRLRIRAWRAENNEVLDRELARMRQAQELRACSSAQRMRAVSARAPAEVRQWAAEHERQVAAGRAARHAATSHFNAPVRTESAFRGM